MDFMKPASTRRSTKLPWVGSCSRPETIIEAQADIVVFLITLSHIGTMGSCPAKQRKLTT